MLMDMPSESADTKWNFKDEKKGVKTKLKYSYGNNNSIIWGIDYINNDGGRYGKLM